MTAWECAVGDCGRVFDTAAAALAHQVEAHDPHDCRVCGATVPAGFFAIHHAFTEHSRADFVRHYDGDSDAIRRREALIDEVLGALDTDVDVLRERLQEEGTDVDSLARAD